MFSTSRITGIPGPSEFSLLCPLLIMDDQGILRRRVYSNIARQIMIAPTTPTTIPATFALDPEEAVDWLLVLSIPGVVGTGVPVPSV